MLLVYGVCLAGTSNLLSQYLNKAKAPACAKECLFNMMESQCRICAQTLPQPITERNKKDKPFSDLLQLASFYI